MANFYFKFQYEHINQAKINALEKVVDEEHVQITYADSGFMVVVVHDKDYRTPEDTSKMLTKKKANQIATKVRDEVWKLNGGTLCEFKEVEEDAVMDYI